MDKLQRKAFQRETPGVRRQEMIDATLEIIGDTGFSGATVREIAKRANVTQGLMRHYFQSKEGLVNAAYDYHMSQMTALSINSDFTTDLSDIERLAITVRANLTEPVLAERNVILWASFISKLRSEPGIREIHKKTYLQFREGLEDLIRNALIEAGKDPGEKTCRNLAIVCNALIDGLWIEGGATPSEFETATVVELGLRSIGAIVGLDLIDALPAELST